MASDEVRTVRRLMKDLERMRAAGLPLLDAGGTPLGWAPEGMAAALTWRDATSRRPEDRTLAFGTAVWGPADTPYAGAVFRVALTFSPRYPCKSPSVGFIDAVLHCNVDEASGSVCVDALDRAWSPTTVVSSIADALLHGLLAAPNPASPLNIEAADDMTTLPPAVWADRVRAHAVGHAWLHAARSEHTHLVAASGAIARPLPPALGGGTLDGAAPPAAAPPAAAPAEGVPTGSAPPATAVAAATGTPARAAAVAVAVATPARTAATAAAAAAAAGGSPAQRA